MRFFLCSCLVSCSVSNTSNSLNSSSSQEKNSETILALPKTWTDSNGNTYIPDLFARRVLKVSDTEIVTLLFGDEGNTEDNCSVEAANLIFNNNQINNDINTIALGIITQLTVSSDDKIYISVYCNGKGHIFLYDLNVSEDPFSRVAGLEIVDGNNSLITNGESALEYFFDKMEDLALDAQEENLYVLMNNLVLKINLTTHIVNVIAGGVDAGFEGENVLATEAIFDTPQGILLLEDGSYFLSDTDNHVIRYVDTQGIITTYAGSFQVEDCIDGVGIEASFMAPTGLAMDPLGTYLYVTDGGCSALRKINLKTQEVSTLSGLLNNAGNVPEGGETPSLVSTLEDARYNGLFGIVFDSYKEVFYVMDRNNNLVKKIDTFEDKVGVLIGGGSQNNAFEEAATDISLILSF